MRTFSNDFKSSLRGVREISSIITYQSGESTYILTTEANDNITTELSDLLGTETGPIEISSEQIINVNPIYDIDLLKSVCKGVQLELKVDLPINTEINVKIGVKVNNAYEYMDYGNYFIQSSTYQADNEDYSLVAYDKMYQSMIDYADDSIEFPITIKNLIITICNKFGWEYELPTFINQDKTINKDLFSEQDMTYRDILDEISQVVGGSLMFNLDNKLIIKYIAPPDNSTLVPFTIGTDKTINQQIYNANSIITDDDFKNINVNFTEKYGPVNALVITSGETTVIDNMVDSTSIATNGKTELKIAENHILLNDSETFISDLFEAINGLEYYIYDFETYGLLVYEPLDRFNVYHENTYYSCVMFNNDLKVSMGMEENCVCEKPTSDVSEYKAVSKEEKAINNAKINIDKANAQIVLKVDSDGKLSQVELGASADNGSTFDVKADNINFEGKTFNLTTEDIAINSTNFTVNKNGDMTCNNATIAGGSLSLQGTEALPEFTLTNPNDSDQKTIMYPGGQKTYDADGIVRTSLSGILGMLSLYYSDSSLSSSLSYLGLNFKENGTTKTSVTAAKVETPLVIQTSKEEDKKNFEPYDNALNEVINTDIYKYNLNYESDEKKKHIGFVIGENRKYSHDITATDDENKEIGVDTYSMVSVLWKAVQEQQILINNLQSQIDELKEEK